MKKGVTILAVDDEPMVRQAIKLLLVHGGYEVELAESGEAALILLTQRKFDLVITDFSMPGMQGDQLVTKIRQHWPSLPIIMATAFVEEFKIFGRPTGSVDALLLKPFSFKELSEAIERVLSGERSDQPGIMPSLAKNNPPPQGFIPPSKS